MSGDARAKHPIDGYWDEWVVRPGDAVRLHLTGAGPAAVTIRPLEGNQVLAPNNDLTWTGELSPRCIVPGSSASERANTTGPWALSFAVRLESPSACRSAVAMLTLSDGMTIDVIATGKRLTVSVGDSLVAETSGIGRWTTVELRHERTWFGASFGESGSTAGVARSAQATVLDVALGAGRLQAAHVRVCNVRLQDAAGERAMFRDASTTRQRNNPVQGLADTDGGHGAIRFHPEDIGDVEWPVTATFTLPTDLPPGVYVASCANRAGTTDIPLFVEPQVPRHRTALVMSTFTYLAYAGYRQASEASTLGNYAAVTDRQVALTGIDHRLSVGIEPGLSLYDRYSDGAATYVVSRRHPLIDLVPGHRHWLTGTTRNFNADLELLGWLGCRSIDVDVLTDDRLHARGPDALEHYDTVLTGSHPEYVSGAILDALERFIATGGHLLYLGGNGFDYVAEPSAASPGDTVEVRRPNEAWSGADPADDTLSNGVRAGRWSERGRPANRLVGAGYCTQGWGPAPGYRQLPDARATELGRALLAGIEPEELIGGFGNSLGGAAGDEIDCIDASRGTPQSTLRIATSEGLHSRHMMGVEPGSPLRADIAYTPHESGGSAFSVGSMNWVPSLVCDVQPNNVATLTLNALELARVRARSR